MTAKGNAEDLSGADKPLDVRIIPETETEEITVLETEYEIIFEPIEEESDDLTLEVLNSGDSVLSDDQTIGSEEEDRQPIDPESGEITCGNGENGDTSWSEENVIYEDPAPVRMYYDVPVPDYFQDYIFDICDEYGLPYDLIFAMMWRESCFDPEAVGGAGEQGYLQIIPSSGADLLSRLGIPYDEYTLCDVLRNPYNNVRCSAYLLSTLYSKGYTGNAVLMCYNFGEYGASLQWEKGVYETQYCIDIANYRANLQYRGYGQ